MKGRKAPISMRFGAVLVEEDVAGLETEEISQMLQEQEDDDECNYAKDHRPQAVGELTHRPEHGVDQHLRRWQKSHCLALKKCAECRSHGAGHQRGNAVEEEAKADKLLPPA